MACTEYQEGAAEQSLTRAWPRGEREEHRNPGLAHPRKPHCTRSNRQENITSTFSTKNFLSGKRTLAKPLLPPPALSLEQQGGTITQIFILLNLWHPVRMEKGSPNCTFISISTPAPFQIFFLEKVPDLKASSKKKALLKRHRFPYRLLIFLVGVQLWWYLAVCRMVPTPPDKYNTHQVSPLSLISAGCRTRIPSLGWKLRARQCRACGSHPSYTKKYILCIARVYPECKHTVNLHTQCKLHIHRNFIITHHVLHTQSERKQQMKHQQITYFVL